MHSLTVIGHLKYNTIIIRTTIYILTIFSVANTFGQTVNNTKRTPNTYLNWMSIDYLNCLKTDLPCICEEPKEYFLINIESSKKYVLAYAGKTNYEYNRYNLRTISNNHYEVYFKEYSQTFFKDTITVVGQIDIKNDTLIFTNDYGEKSKFILYGMGQIDNYFTEHIKLLNSALTIRGYDNLNKILQTDSLKCWCNWELENGMNSVFGKENKYWILEKEENTLYIYEWKNPPSEKTFDLKIEKKLFKKLKW